MRDKAIDRRAVFLSGASAACLALVPVTPNGLEYVGITMSIWCLVLAAASWLDHWSRGRS